MNWQQEAERLRNVAGQLQDETDRLGHDLDFARERLEDAHRRIVELNAENDALRTRCAA
jgi:chromosome segregation ATPase